MCEFTAFCDWVVLVGTGLFLFVCTTHRKSLVLSCEGTVGLWWKEGTVSISMLFLDAPALACSDLMFFVYASHGGPAAVPVPTAVPGVRFILLP